jgi:hypothetical protein
VRSSRVAGSGCDIELSSYHSCLEHDYLMLMRAPHPEDILEYRSIALT